METTDFSWALRRLKLGKRLTREGWNGKGMYLEAQYPDEHSANTLPYIYIIVVGGARVPWEVSHSDLFGEDWRIVE